MASSTKLWAGSQLLTKSSWDPGWLTSARRVAARDQLPRGDTWHTWDSALAVHPGNQAAVTGKVIKTYRPSGTVCSPSTWSPELLGPGKGTKHGPNWVCVLWSMREPEAEQLNLGSSRNPDPLCTVPVQSNLEPEHCRPVKHMCHELGQTQCGPYTVNTPHTCQWYLFAVFLPLHSTTEQVSLNKWPPSPACVRVEIRHWRDLQTEETKINKEGTTLEVTGATD